MMKSFYDDDLQKPEHTMKPAIIKVGWKLNNLLLFSGVSWSKLYPPKIIIYKKRRKGWKKDEFHVTKKIINFDLCKQTSFKLVVCWHKDFLKNILILNVYICDSPRYCMTQKRVTTIEAIRSMDDVTTTKTYSHQDPHCHVDLASSS